MYTVRRIPNEMPAIYRPKFRLVEPRPRAVVSARRTFLWIGLVLACLLPLAGSGTFTIVSSGAVVTMLPGIQSNIPIYPGAQQVEYVSSDFCRQEISFTSDDSNDKIGAFYKEMLAKEAWRGPTDMYGTLQFSKGSKDSSISFVGYSKKEVRLSVRCIEPSLALQPQAQTPTPTPPPINITRQQYDEALAKWRASGVEEYVITVSTFAFLGGVETLHVSDHGNKLLMLMPSPTPAITPDPEYSEDVKEDTVEGMFSEIEKYLQGDKVIHSGAIFSTGDFHMAYSVEFDPDLGYPVHLFGIPVTAPGVEVDDAGWEKTVTELKILKRSSPTPTPLTISK